MALIQFTRNHSDHSTPQGFQFEFFCDKCGNGYRTTFQQSTTGTISTVLDTASNLLGGLFGQASNVANSIHSAAWEKEHDSAFIAAIEEAQPHFHKCKRCGKWVDTDCWNPGRGLCKECAPDLEEEFSSVQVQSTVMKAREQAYTDAQIPEGKFKKDVVGKCPHCQATLTGGKFCPECGKPVAQKKFCTDCGKEIAAGVKFCPECGAKQG